MKLYTAVDDGGDYFMILAAPDINRTSFESQVRIRLAEESVPNPDIKAQRLTLQEWPTILAFLTDMRSPDAYNDLVWTYPGQWITLGVGEREPVPAEFASRPLEDYDAEGYALDDPKHPTYHERMASVWDGREK